MSKIVISLGAAFFLTAAAIPAGWCASQRPASPAASLLRRIDANVSGGSVKIEMDLSAKVRHELHRVKEDPAKGLPSRFYVDLVGARLVPEAGRPIVLEDRLVGRIRTGQFSPEVVRVVVDMKAPGHPKIYAGKAPFRLVLEIEPAEDERKEVLAAKKVEPAPSARVARPVTPRPLKIVLDPGHGGKDPGAIGVGGVTEKDLVLALARRLAQRLRKGMGATVILTREDDRFIALEDRTAIANDEDADLFISLHINASPNPRARGLETYYLDNTDDEAAIRLAARENATSRRNISDLQFILSDLVQSSKMEDSIRLAHHLQGSMVTRVGQKYGGTVDLGVKKALFHVLVGARMPSVLVEVSFITNRIEGRNLTTPAYQETVVNALYEGIERYRASAFAARNL